MNTCAKLSLYFEEVTLDDQHLVISEEYRQIKYLSQKVPSLLGKERVFAVVAENDHIEELAKKKLPWVVLIRMKSTG